MAKDLYGVTLENSFQGALKVLGPPQGWLAWGPPGLAWLSPKCHDLTPWPMVRAGCRCHLGRAWVPLSSRFCIVSHEAPGQVAGDVGGRPGSTESALCGGNGLCPDVTQ